MAAHIRGPAAIANLTAAMDLAALPCVGAEREAAEQCLIDAVRDAREVLTWQEIGEAFGVTRQAVHDRLARHLPTDYPRRRGGHGSIPDGPVILTRDGGCANASRYRMMNCVGCTRQEPAWESWPTSVANRRD